MSDKGYTIGMVKSFRDKYKLGQELLESIREIDKFEIEGLGFTTQQGIEASMRDCTPVYFARTKEGKLGACWGLQILVDKVTGHKTYLIWALGTDEIDHYKRAFMVESRQILERWKDMYGDLTNTVAVCNKKAVAWLKWLGAEFDEPRLINGIAYVDFHLRKDG